MTGPADTALRQRLQVVALDDGRAALRLERDAGCAACAARAGCGAAALAQLLGTDRDLSLPGDAPLTAGTDVTVAMERDVFLGAALRAYLIPPVALAGAASVCAALGLSDLATAVICVPALAVSFVPLRRADRRAGRAPVLWLEPADTAP
ncbi:SoxR reducing system RseC family protein [Actibacterium ureilyticum]|uniref:SoxR reducing system RseC family protein n=1 Tax=Actibacterium ureilyticum TaxID=1590614 RepID=UPI0015961B36|nr:SoxR reducing system RseC family protein [Actibacterium ureilyticum]